MVRDFLNSERLKNISRGLVIFTPAMTLLHLISWTFIRSLLDFNLPLGFMIKTNRFLLVITIWSFLPFILALFFSGLKPFFAYFVFLMTIPFLCVFTVGYFYSKSIIEEISFDNQMFYFVVQSSLGDPWANYYLFICNSNGRNCTKEFSFTDTQLIPAEFQINAQGDQLNIFLNSEIEYIYSKSLKPLNQLDVTASVDFWITLKSEVQGNNFFLSRCSNPRIEEYCSLWLLELTNDYVDLRSGEFSVGDESPNEFLFYIGNELIFSVTNEPNCHIEGCSFVEQ